MQQVTDNNTSNHSDSRHLAETSIIQPNPSTFIENEMPPYISEVGRIRIMRDFYKKETQKYMGEDLRDTLENEKCTKLEIANKLKKLVDHNKSLLSHMNKERTRNGDFIKELVQMSNSLYKSHIDGKTERNIMADAKESLNKLLSDIKK